MMLQGLLQIMVTIWLGVHPVTYTFPKQFNFNQCQPAAEALFKRLRKDHGGAKRVDIECVPATGSDA